MKLIQKFNKDMTMFVHYVVRFILEKEFRKKNELGIQLLYRQFTTKKITFYTNF